MAPNKPKRSKPKKPTNMSSSKDVEQLQADYARAEEKYNGSYAEYMAHSERASELQQRMEGLEDELSQLSSSGSAAQNARGYGPNYSTGSGEHTVQTQNRRIALRNEINDLPNSINHFLEKANEAWTKAERSREKIEVLGARLSYLNANQMYDCDNWYPMGGPGDDEDEGAAGSSAAGYAGPSNVTY